MPVRQASLGLAESFDQGVDAVWLPQGGVSPDTMMLLSDAKKMVEEIVKSLG